FEVKLHEGLGILEFGQSYDEVLAILGEPSEIEILEDEDEDDDDNLNTALCYFYELGLTLFLEGEEERYLVSIESDNVNLKLFGKNLFAMNEAEIINLMKLNGYNDMYTEDEEWGERRVCFEDAMIDFYFSSNKLVTVNWSCDIDEDVAGDD
ncbi:MAG TPA: hypothetical protein VLH16_00945, partial [Bacteroidales bacterium]|nr:hypothetical protein [Bacteroidales bacterium]